MTIDDLDALLDFHYWARDRVLDAAATLTPEQFDRDLGNSFKSVRETLVHIYWTDWAWYQIWHGTFPSAQMSADAFQDLEAIRRAWGEHEEKVREYVRAQAGTDAHMVQHLVNHGTYHRGQLTMMLRQLGAQPPVSTDLIRYYRERVSAVGAAS